MQNRTLSVLNHTNEKKNGIQFESDWENKQRHCWSKHFRKVDVNFSLSPIFPEWFYCMVDQHWFQTLDNRIDINSD